MRPLLLTLLLLPTAHAQATPREDSLAPKARVSYQSFAELLQETEELPEEKETGVACRGNEAFPAEQCQGSGNRIHTSGACFGDDPNDTQGVPAPCCCGG